MKALPRSQLICSSGKDKYTFDSERADAPPRPSESSPSPSSVSRASVVSRLKLPRPLRDLSGRFANPWPSGVAPSFGSILKLNLTRERRHVPSKAELDVALPILEPRMEAHERSSDGVTVTWLGHSTCLVTLDGVTLLTDPVFSERASPSQVVGPKRFRAPPASVHALPSLDAVVISHAHYDHLDLNSVLALNARFGSDLRWFVPLGLGAWMSRAGVANVVELDWWAENALPDKSDVSFVLTPAQHWSKRTLTDDNRALWGSWTVVGPKHRFFFAGDTAYCDVFRLIGHLYGPFDLTALPIGAYEPRRFMQHQHVEPREAVQMHVDLRARVSLAVHWGTFALTSEPCLEPPLKLREALEEAGLEPRAFVTFLPGETRLLAGRGRFERLNRRF